MALLMDYTTVGRTRIDEIWSDGLVFEVTHVAYGISGYNAVTQEVPLVLNPAATALGAEVYRKEVAAITNDEVAIPRGKDTVYTTVSGEEFNDIIGEAGLIATVIDPGSTGLSVGDEFLLAHAHFGRVVFTLFDRLAIEWPLDLQGNILVYVGTSVVTGNAMSLLPSTGAGSYGAYALTGGALPSGVTLNPVTGEISGTPDVAALLGGSPIGVYSGIEVTADGTVVSNPITINVLGVPLPMPTRFWSMDNRATWTRPTDIFEQVYLVEDSGGGNDSIFNSGVPGAVGAEGEAFTYSGNEYTEIADSPDVRVGSGDFVLSAFLRQASAAGGSGNYIVGKGSIGAGGIRYSLNLDSANVPRFQVDDNTVAVTASGAIGQTDGGAFHTLTGQRIGTDIELYVDGALAQQQFIGAYGSLDNVRPFVMGALYDETVTDISPTTRFDGDVDAVALWVGQSFTAEQMATIEWIRASTGRTLGSWIGGTGPGSPVYVDQNIQDGVAVSFSPTHPSGDDVSFTYFAFTPLPNGLSVNPVNGQVTGTTTVVLNSGALATLVAGTQAAGSVTANTGAATNDGDTFVLDDGINDPVTFEFDNDASVVETNALRAVPFTGAETADQMRDLIVTAVTNAPVLDISAAAGGAGVADLTNDRYGTIGDQPITQTGSSLAAIASMVGGANMTVTGLTGMAPDSVGRDLIISGVDPVNNPLNGGTFEIVAYNSANSVDVIPNFAPGADANNGSIVWEEREKLLHTVQIGVTDGINLNVSNSFTIGIS